MYSEGLDPDRMYSEGWDPDPVNINPDPTLKA